MVAMPKKAMIHIQKMAPGPPVRMAPQAPMIFPVPTCAAIAVVSAWNEVSPPSCPPCFGSFLPNTSFMASPKHRTCTNLVFTLKNRPHPTSKTTRI